MKINIALFFVLTSIGFSANAGAGKAGDGGHLISCDAPYHWNGDLLDSYEGWQITGSASFDVKVASTSSTVTGVDVREIYEAQRRMQEVVPTDHPILTVFVEALRINQSANVEMVPEEQVGLTDDSGPIEAKTPPNCRVYQLVARRNVGGRTVFYFNRDFSWLFGGDLTAPICIHEALHDYFGRQPTTLAVREVMWWLGAPENYRNRTRGLIQEVIRSRLPIDPERFREAGQPVSF